MLLQTGNLRLGGRVVLGGGHVVLWVVQDQQGAWVRAVPSAQTAAVKSFPRIGSRNADTRTSRLNDFVNGWESVLLAG